MKIFGESDRIVKMYNVVEGKTKRVLKSTLLVQFERFIDELLCPIYIIGGDIELMRAAMPEITSGVYLQLRNDGRVYVGEAVDIVHRQTEHFAEGVKIWAFAVIIFPRISEKARKARETEVMEMAMKRGFELANIAKVQMIKKRLKQAQSQAS